MRREQRRRELEEWLESGDDSGEEVEREAASSGEAMGAAEENGESAEAESGAAQAAAGQLHDSPRASTGSDRRGSSGRRKQQHQQHSDQWEREASVDLENPLSMETRGQKDLSDRSTPDEGAMPPLIRGANQLRDSSIVE